MKPLRIVVAVLLSVVGLAAPFWVVAHARTDDAGRVSSLSKFALDENTHCLAAIESRVWIGDACGMPRWILVACDDGHAYRVEVRSHRGRCQHRVRPWSW